MSTSTVPEIKVAKLESKIDDIHDKLEQLVRLEVRHEHSEYRIGVIEKAVVEVKNDVQVMHNHVAANSMLSGNLERLGWILVSAVVGTLAYFAKHFGGTG